MIDFRGSGPIRIGVSACLLGQEVRFDGGHKRNAFLTGALGHFVEFVPVCPEVDIGFGVPRESLRLVRDGRGAVRMIANKSGADLTVAMRAYAERRAAALERADLSGYVLKKDSPSRGMERVRVYGRAGMLLVMGPSGVGKTSLMRAIAGLWNSGSGRIERPPLDQIMFLPQRPYMILRTKRQVPSFSFATLATSCRATSPCDSCAYRDRSPRRRSGRKIPSRSAAPAHMHACRSSAPTRGIGQRYRRCTG